MTHTPAQNDKLPVLPGLGGRSRGVTTLLLTLIFVAGALLGAGVTVLVRHVSAPPRRLAPPKSHVELYNRQMDRIIQDVKLTEQQIPKVRWAVVNTWGPKRQEVLRFSKPRMIEAYEALSREVLPVLTGEQKVLWDEYVQGRLAWVKMDPMICVSTTAPTSRPASGPATQPGE
jgi:hypothetical protein